MDKSALFRERMLQYSGMNFSFSLYYDKLYKKEYLPSRIRYNQFFFWAAFIGLGYGLLSKRSGGGMFCPKEGAPGQTELADRKYYTSERSVVNIIMRQVNKSSVSSHVSK